MTSTAGARDLGSMLHSAAEQMLGRRLGVVRHRDLVQRDTGADPELPRRIGTAPAVFSTRTELVVPLRFVWDVNGYYRALGVHWTAGKRELREAYQERDGQSSDRLTYVLDQLLDPAVRRQYDAMPAGSVFWDKYVMEEANRQVKLRLAIRILDLGGDEELAAWSAKAEGWLSDTPPDQDLDGPWAACDDQGAPPQHETPPSPQFPWGHYLWRSEGVADSVLAEWQRLVILAAAERGIQARIAVGACSRTPHRTIVAKVGRVVVAFINEDHDPSEEAAALAAESIEHATR